MRARSHTLPRGGSRPYAFTKIQGTTSKAGVHFTGCQLHVNKPDLKKPNCR